MNTLLRQRRFVASDFSPQGVVYEASRDLIIEMGRKSQEHNITSDAMFTRENVNIGNYYQYFEITNHIYLNNDRSIEIEINYTLITIMFLLTFQVKTMTTC